MAIIRVRLFDVKSAQHLLNDYDTSRCVNEFLENFKCILNMVSPFDWYLGILRKQTTSETHYNSLCWD